MLWNWTCWCDEVKPMGKRRPTEGIQKRLTSDLNPLVDQLLLHACLHTLKLKYLLKTRPMVLASKCVSLYLSVFETAWLK